MAIEITKYGFFTVQLISNLNKRGCVIFYLALVISTESNVLFFLNYMQISYNLTYKKYVYFLLYQKRRPTAGSAAEGYGRRSRGSQRGQSQGKDDFWNIFKTYSFPLNVRSPEPVTITYLSYRPARLHRQAESIPWNRFLGSLRV